MKRILQLGALLAGFVSLAAGSVEKEVDERNDNSFFLSPVTQTIALDVNTTTNRVGAPPSLVSGEETAVIIASTEDGFVSDPSTVTTNNPYALPIAPWGLKLGASDANGNGNATSVILPFALPAIPSGKEISDASLSVNVNYGREWINFNIDLYGLSYNASPSISSADHFAGDFGTGNGSDTGIADDFFSKNVDGGNLDSEREEVTEGTANTALMNFIKAQYTAGAIAGDFVFLRLSIDNNTNPQGAHYFGVDDASMDDPPTLSITFSDATGGNTAPVLASIGDQTADEGVAKSVAISATDGESDALTFSISGNPSGITLTDNTDGTASIEISDATAAGTHENIVIAVSDGVDTDTETISIEVTAASGGGDVTDIIASTEDGVVSDPGVVTSNNPYSITLGTWGLKVGASDANGAANTTSAIIPFALPAIPSGKEISDASLSVNVNYGREWVNFNVDLYGLSYNASASISSADHYAGDFGTGNGSDTGIADDFFSKNVAGGTLDTEREETTDATANTALTNFIKAQYTSGAIAGDFVFLRLSIDNNTNPQGAHFFGVDDASMDDPPTLSITFSDATGSNTAPVLASIGNQTADEGVAKSVAISATDGESDALTFSISGNPSGITLTDNTDGTASIEISDATAAGTHENIVITVSDGVDTDTETISIEVAAAFGGTVLVGLSADGMVNDASVSTTGNPSITDAFYDTGSGMKLGSSDNGGGTTPISAVLVFELPVRNSDQVVESGELIVDINWKRQWVIGSFDLYGLSYSSSSDISAAMHYDGAFSSDQNGGTGLQDGFYTAPAGGAIEYPGAVSSSAGASALIAAYINAQYDAGAVAGDYVFLRLSPAEDYDDNGNFVFVSSGDNADASVRPKLNLTFSTSSNTAPELVAIGNQTAEEGVAKSIAISATDGDGDDLTFSISGNPSGITLTDNNDGTASIEISDAVAVGTHNDIIVSVSDGVDTDSETISITITASLAEGEIVLVGSAADGMVNDPLDTEVNNPYTFDVTYSTGFGMKLGSSDNGGGGTVISNILVFELPERSAGEVVEAAELTVDINWKRQWVIGSFDLYGLTYSSENTITSAMHYDGAFSSDQNGGTGLQDGFYTAPAGGAIEYPGAVSSSAGASTLIAAYVNAQYDAGAEAGDFVFIRISPAEDYDDNGNFLFVSSGDSQDESIRPKLSLTFASIPGAPVLAPIGDQTTDEGVAKSVAISATDGEGDDLTFSISGNPSGVTLTDNTDGTASLEIANTLAIGTYDDIVITVNDGAIDISERISIVITDPNFDPSQQMNLDAPTGDRFTLTDQVWPANVGEGTVALWNDDKTAAASITIDDNVEVDHSWWLGQQTALGMDFTWFIIDNQVTDWAKYQTLIDAGNEVQGHDDDISGLSDADYKLALESIQTDINTNLTDNTALTYAYPFGDASKFEVAREVYISMRGVNGVLNNANAINYLDVNSRSATNDVHDIRVLLDADEKLFNNSYYRGWASYHYHSVASSKSETETFLTALSAKQDSIWVGKYTDVAQYGQERDSHTLTMDAVESTNIKFTLEDEMNDAYFDFPLTVKVRIDNSWTDIAATQDGTTIESSIVEYGGNKYAFVKAVPDAGQVTLTDGVNATPVLTAIGDQTVEEGETLTISIAVSDADSDPLTITASNLPSFAVLTDNGDGTATIAVTPSTGDAAVYNNIVVSATDGLQTADETISITVTAVTAVLGLADDIAQLTAYPNPVSGNAVTISLADMDATKPLTLVLSDVAGRRIFTRNFIGKEEIILDGLSELHEGLYFVRVKQLTSESFVKLVIRR